MAEGVAVLEQPPLVRADDGAHVAILQVGVLQGDPGGTHIGGAGRLPVPVVLVPADVAGGFLAAVGADPRFVDGLVMPEAHGVHAHQARADCAQERAGGDCADGAAEPEGVALLAHGGRTRLHLGRAVLGLDLRVVLAAPHAFLRLPQFGDSFIAEELGADPIAALPIFLAHGRADQFVDVDAVDSGWRRRCCYCCHCFRALPGVGLSGRAASVVSPPQFPTLTLLSDSAQTRMRSTGRANETSR